MSRQDHLIQDKTWATKRDEREALRDCRKALKRWAQKPVEGGRMNLAQKVILWKAVNEYAQSTGGDTSASNKNQLDRRMNAVVGVERVVDEIISAALSQQPAGPEVPEVLP